MGAPGYNCPFSAGGTIRSCTTVREGNQAKAAILVDMTNADADLTYTAVKYGESENDIQVVHVDPAANNAALAVSVVGRVITVSLATDGAGVITSTAAEVVAAIAGSAAAAALVVATDENAGAGVVNAKAAATLTGGLYNGCPCYDTGAQDCTFAQFLLWQPRGGAVPDEH